MNTRTLLVRPQLGFDLLRVYLGVGLLVRGALFAHDPSLIDQLLDGRGWFLPALAAHAVVLSHLLGGSLLALGCCTRFAAAVQLPVLAGALFFVHWREGLFNTTQSVEFVALVLVALILYTLCGAGELSVDAYLARTSPEVPTGEPALGFAAEAAHPSRPAPRSVPPALDGASGVRESMDLGLAPDPPWVLRVYRDVKLELLVVLAMLVVLVVLLAAGLYVAAPVWLIGSSVLFVLWRIGRTEFG
jgi:uncharacterized membrane protein YphA (DoxX/SURF4 family)